LAIANSGFEQLRIGGKDESSKEDVEYSSAIIVVGDSDLNENPEKEAEATTSSFSSGYDSCIRNEESSEGLDGTTCDTKESPKGNDSSQERFSQSQGSENKK
jgi:hypothetical protein